MTNEMTKKQNELPEITVIENARVGYQAAISLWTSQGDMIWSKFNAIMVANSIILGFTGIGIAINNRIVAVIMSGVGFILCPLWFVLISRAFDYFKYWIRSARELEEDYLNPIKTVSRGRQYAEGEIVKFGVIHLKMSWLSKVKVEHAIYWSIFTFWFLYLIIFIYAFDICWLKFLGLSLNC